MLLAKILERGAQYRLFFDAGLGVASLELEFAKADLKKVAHGRTRVHRTNKGFLFSAKFFEVDDESQLLTIWQEGQGVSVELAGWVAYGTLLAIEPA